MFSHVLWKGKHAVSSGSLTLDDFGVFVVREVLNILYVVQSNSSFVKIVSVVLVQVWKSRLKDFLSWFEREYGT